MATFSTAVTSRSNKDVFLSKCSIRSFFASLNSVKRAFNDVLPFFVKASAGLAFTTAAEAGLGKGLPVDNSGSMSMPSSASGDLLKNNGQD